MNKQQLKKVLTPIIKEVVRESLNELILEEGVLSSVIKECLSGVRQSIVAEERSASNRQPKAANQTSSIKEAARQLYIGDPPQSLNNQEYYAEPTPRKKPSEMIKTSGFSYMGATDPQQSAARSSDPLAKYHPSDAGIDISRWIKK